MKNLSESFYTKNVPNIFKIFLKLTNIANANVERIFSLISSKWTDERNRFSVENVKGLTFAQFNFKETSTILGYENIQYLEDDDLVNATSPQRQQTSALVYRNSSVQNTIKTRATAAEISKMTSKFAFVTTGGNNQIETAGTVSKAGRRKKVFLYCKTEKTKLSRHVTWQHATEELVLQYLSISDKADRRKIMSKIEKRRPIFGQHKPQSNAEKLHVLRRPKNPKNARAEFGSRKQLTAEAIEKEHYDKLSYKTKEIALK